MDTHQYSFEQVYESTQQPEVKVLSASIHARDIHDRNNTPASLRPRFSLLSPEIGRNHAHRVLQTVLDLLKESDPDRYSDETLIRAAHLLESLYLSKPIDFPKRSEELVTAALAYYLAGQYPRAYVIMKSLIADSSVEADSSLMCWLFLRDLTSIVNETTKYLSNRNHHDAALAKAVFEGSISTGEAIGTALRSALHRIYLLLYEFARTGDEARIAAAVKHAQHGFWLAVSMFKDEQMEQWWWIFHTTICLLKEYWRNSIWMCLHPMLMEDQSGLVEKYIKNAFNLHLPILELWRSQAHAVPYLRTRSSFCLKMPTSAGKTRIAELFMLQYFADEATWIDLKRKCLYVAPYRALAVEVENNFKRSFEPLGIGVSQLYGGYDLNPTEQNIFDESRIVVGTPEKLDALFRYNVEIGSQIGLIIIDEGHIIDTGDRGLRYEMFINRLVKRFQRKAAVPLLFISAVMPNVDQFSRWITGQKSDEGVIESKWRPSQQMLGILTWQVRGDIQTGRIDYLYKDFEKVNEDFFVTNFVTEFRNEDLRSVGSSRRKFPSKSNKAEILALAAIVATREGATYAYIPQKQWISPVANALITAIDILSQIYEKSGERSAVLPIDQSPEGQAKLKYCITAVEKSMGTGSLVANCLKRGFVIHHSDIPRDVRVLLEELIRDSVLQLVIATDTLAQGVNLPVRTVLIHSLFQGKDKQIKARDFWNICGRAGRAMKETEGKILVLCDTSDCETPRQAKGKYDRLKDMIDTYVQKATSEQALEEVISAVRNMLQRLLIAAYESFYQGVDEVTIAELCEFVVSSDDNWLGTDMKKLMSIFDNQLLALIEEQQLAADNIDFENVYVLFKDSILYIQLQDDENAGFTYEHAVSLIVHRLTKVLEICNTAAKRRRYYVMGISIEDCATIEAKKEELLTFIAEADEYMSWSVKVRADYIVKLCQDFLMILDDVLDSANSETPSCWPEIIRLWLTGQDADQIATSDNIPKEWSSPEKISILIDNLCQFRLAWGLNAIAMFLDALDVDTDEEPSELPAVVPYFGVMLRFGVHDPIATALLTRGIDNRKGALAVASLYDGELDASEITNWIKSLDTEVVKGCTDDDDLLRIISEFVLSFQTNNSSSSSVIHRLDIEIPNTVDVPILFPDDILAKQIDRSVHLLASNDLSYIGTIHLDNLSEPIVNGHLEGIINASIMGETINITMLIKEAN